MSSRTLVAGLILLAAATLNSLSQALQVTAFGVLPCHSVTFNFFAIGVAIS